MILKKYFLVFLIFYNMLFAQQITWVIPFKVGGTMTTIQKLFVPELEKKGWDVKVIQFNDCASANNFIKNEKGPLLITWTTESLSLYKNSDSICFRNFPQKENFVNTQFEWKDYLCSVGVKKDIFSEKNNNFKLGAGSAILEEKFKNYLKNFFPNIKIIQYANSTEMNIAIAAKEIDYVLDFAGFQSEKNGKAFCSYYTGNSNEKYIGINEFIKDFGIKSTTLYIEIENFNDTIKEKFIEDFNNVYYNLDEYRNFLNIRGVNMFDNKDIAYKNLVESTR